jgi:hypothetical protein
MFNWDQLIKHARLPTLWLLSKKIINSGFNGRNRGLFGSLFHKEKSVQLKSGNV